MSLHALGNTVIDADAHTLSATGKSQHISPQPMRVLLALAKHSDRPVPFDMIMDALWHGRDDGPQKEIITVMVFGLRGAFRIIGSDLRIDSICRVAYQLVVPHAPGIIVVAYTPRQHEALRQALAIVRRLDPDLAAMVAGEEVLA